MMKEHWVAEAFTSDALVAELLLRLKQSSSSDSSYAPPPPTTASTTTSSLNPLGWGNRKFRSKPSTTTTVAVTNGFRKDQQQRSPSTPLSWSGGGAGSTSDGYDESSRPSDLASGGRSTKVEGLTTSTYSKSTKRKDLDSMSATFIQKMATSDGLKRIRIDLHRNPEKEPDQFVQISCNVESEIEIRERRFVLPDLNMTPSDEELPAP